MSEEVLDPSSCFVQHQWNWSNDVKSNRWTKPMQYYRLRAPYYPGFNDTTNSFDVVETRNKVRGQGKVLSTLFTTEPGKHCTIYGWSVNIGINGNV